MASTTPGTTRKNSSTPQKHPAANAARSSPWGTSSGAIPEAWVLSNSFRPNITGPLSAARCCTLLLVAALCCTLLLVAACCCPGPTPALSRQRPLPLRHSAPCGAPGPSVGCLLYTSPSPRDGL